jgi:hypothetical protein
MTNAIIAFFMLCVTAKIYSIILPVLLQIEAFIKNNGTA